jgi:energy-coupling factor transport system permease protein
MMLSLYVERASVVHRVHPVAKVVGLLFMFVAAFVADRPLALLPLLAGVLALAAIAGAAATLWRLRLLFTVIVLVTAGTWSFFYGKDLGFSAPGLWYGVTMGLKLGTFFACGILFLATTKVEELATALRVLKVPYYFGFTLTLAVRLVPVFFGATVAVHEAQRCRGLDFGRGSAGTRLRQYGRLVVPVFLGALRRADRMAMALEIRGFNSGRTRTAYPRAAFGFRDVLVLLATGAIAVVYVSLWSTGHVRFSV